MTLPCLLLLSLLLFANAAFAGSKAPAPPSNELKIECVPASRASELLGQHGCVAGKVFSVTTGKSGHQHLALCPRRSGCSFNVSVSKHLRDKVGDLSYLRGKYVAFDGNVTDYRGRSRIVLKDRGQIHVTAGNPPTEFDSAVSRPKGTSLGKSTRVW